MQIYVDTVGDPKSYKAKLQRYFPRHSHIAWTVASKADATYPVVGAASIAAKVTRDSCLETWQYAERALPCAPQAAPERKRKRDDSKTQCLSRQRPGADAETAVEALVRAASDADDADTPAPVADDIWQLGSGYPGDPRTVRYLKSTLDPVFGWPGVVRFSWATAKTMLEEKVRASESLPPTLFGTRRPAAMRAYAVHWMDEPAHDGKKQATLAGFFAKKPGARSVTTQAAAPDPATSAKAFPSAAPSTELQQVLRHDLDTLQASRPPLWQSMALRSTSASDLI